MIKLAARDMGQRKPLALIIEDDARAADALGLILADWGAEVLHLQGESDLARRLDNGLGDVRWIITDFHLGDGLDGVALVQGLKAQAPQARVLVLSGSFPGKASAAAEKAGLEIMPKPARAAAIVAWLERA